MAVTKKPWRLQFVHCLLHDTANLIACYYTS